MKKFYNLILITLSLTHSFGATIYCSPAGGGSGVDFNNLATMPTTTGFTRGNTYVLVEGSYGGKTFSTAASGSTPITIRKASTTDSAVAGYATTLFDGQATFTGITFSTVHWIFDGITGGGPSAWTNGFGFKVSVTSTVDGGKGARFNNSGGDVVMRHVEFQGNGGDGASAATSNDAIYALGGNTITLSYAYIYDWGRCPFLIATDNFTAEYVYVGQFESDASEHSEIASISNGEGEAGEADNMIFRWCIFTWVEGTGGLIMNGDNLEVYGCVFVNRNAGWAGANGMIGTWSDSSLTGNKIYNNTFIASEKVFGHGSGGASSWDARNNVFYDVDVPSYDGSYTVHDYNHYVDLRGASPTESNDTTGTGDPFVDSANDNFNLVSAPTTGDTSISSAYRTDWNGVVNTGRGALAFGAGGGGSGVTVGSGATLSNGVTIQ